MSTITAEERREILRRANRLSNQTKQMRAGTKAWLAEPTQTWESRERLAQLLLGDPVPHLAGVEVVHILCWCRGIREAKARRIMRTVGLDGLKRVGQLTPRQARHLAGVLRHGYHDQLDLAATAAPA
jgi:hypothetical protein